MVLGLISSVKLNVHRGLIKLAALSIKELQLLAKSALPAKSYAIMAPVE